ncbi:Protein of unknown function DUF615 [gamma proteobacterium HdN1]|nr:Protein of unknown function DUF615 [gamma proteobacterium HdN1]
MSRKRSPQDDNYWADTPLTDPSTDNDHSESLSSYHPDYDGPSKSLLKRQSAHMQELGEKLSKLDASHWDRLPLSDSLRAALVEAQRISSHEGLRRHRQYIGKLMRNEAIEPIEAYFKTLEDHRELNTRAFHELENLRERLITGDHHVIGEVIAKYPGVDSPQLRQLVRNAKKEHERNTSDTHSGKVGVEHSRKLFRYLRDLEEAQAGAAG